MIGKMKDTMQKVNSVDFGRMPSLKRRYGSHGLVCTQEEFARHTTVSMSNTGFVACG